MKPQHTQGDWKIGTQPFGDRKNCIQTMAGKTLAICQHDTKGIVSEEEAEANAQRIVTCVNEYEALKKKADMHDELVESVKVQLDIIKNLIASKRVVNLDEAISYYEQLLKRSEQK